MMSHLLSHWSTTSLADPWGEGGPSRRRLDGDVCGVGDSPVVFMTVPNGFGWHWPKVVI